MSESFTPAAESLLHLLNLKMLALLKRLDLFRMSVGLVVVQGLLEPFGSSVAPWIWEGLSCSPQPRS